LFAKGYFFLYYLIMEDLTKTQIILLCLLVSFVTSIGTGVITFSLLSETPQNVTQTINRVVERTIEKVTPASIDDKTIVKEVTTVVVKEEDLVIDAVGKNTKSIVRVRYGLNDTFYGLGVVVNKDGLIVTDSLNFNPENSYEVFLSDGKSYPLTHIDLKEKIGLIFFKIKKDEEDKTEFSPVVIGNSDNLKLGQSVIGVSGVDQTSVAFGRVSGLKYSVATSTNPQRLETIQTDIILKDGAFGGPLINLSGQVVGLNIANISVTQNGNFIPINSIKSIISTAEAK
jgi:S1-C subfamily serine protease